MSRSPLIPPELHNEIIERFSEALDGVLHKRVRPRVSDSIPFPVVLDDTMPRDEIRMVGLRGGKTEVLYRMVVQEPGRVLIAGPEGHEVLEPIQDAEVVE